MSRRANEQASKGGKLQAAAIKLREIRRSLVPARRFPPPWFVEEQDACFIVRDHGGQALIKGAAVLQEYLPIGPHFL
jgi:hypothetical protein